MDVSWSPIILKLKSLKEYYFHPSSPPLSSNQSPPPQNSVTLSFSPQAWDVQSPPTHTHTPSLSDQSWHTYGTHSSWWHWNKKWEGWTHSSPCFTCSYINARMWKNEIRATHAWNSLLYPGCISWIPSPGLDSMVFASMELLLSHPHHCLPLSFPLHEAPPRGLQIIGGMSHE